MLEKIIAEIDRQLQLRSEITCVGFPYVVLNGEELKETLAKLTAGKEAETGLIGEVDCE